MIPWASGARAPWGKGGGDIILRKTLFNARKRKVAQRTQVEVTPMRGSFGEGNSASFPERSSVFERLVFCYVLHEKSRGEGELG